MKTIILFSYRAFCHVDLQKTISLPKIFHSLLSIVIKIIRQSQKQRENFCKSYLVRWSFFRLFFSLASPTASLDWIISKGLLLAVFFVFHSRYVTRLFISPLLQLSKQSSFQNVEKSLCVRIAYKRILKQISNIVITHQS